MLPDRVSNPGPLIYESGALPIALRGPARQHAERMKGNSGFSSLGGIGLCVLTIVMSAS